MTATQTKFNPAPFIPAAIGAVVALLLALAISAPASAFVVFIGFGAMIGALFGLLRANWVPFDFQALNKPRPRAPRATVFNNTTAQEDGSSVLNQMPMFRRIVVLLVFVAAWVLLIAAFP